MDQTVIRTSRVRKYVLFNPELPFIYLPSDDFRAFSKPIKDKFGGEIECKDGVGCYFSKNCDSVDKKNFNIYVHLTSPKSDFVDWPFKISGKNLFIKGTEIGATETGGDSNKCYIGVFPYENSFPRQDLWYLGSLAM